MKKILIFGNSGSGKSTLARHLSEQFQLSHLDLDTLAWDQPTSPGNPPERKPIIESQNLISEFTKAHKNWVVEGCYSDLLALLLDDSTEIIYLNLPITLCIENAKARPWEAHKYESKAAQDANLDMLIEWISEYESRQDNFSAFAHAALFESYNGEKKMLTENQKWQ